MAHSSSRKQSSGPSMVQTTILARSGGIGIKPPPGSTPFSATSTRNKHSISPEKPSLNLPVAAKPLIPLSDLPKRTNPSAGLARCLISSSSGFEDDGFEDDFDNVLDNTLGVFPNVFPAGRKTESGPNTAVLPSLARPTSLSRPQGWPGEQTRSGKSPNHLSGTGLVTPQKTDSLSSPATGPGSLPIQARPQFRAPGFKSASKAHSVYAERARMASSVTTSSRSSTKVNPSTVIKSHSASTVKSNLSPPSASHPGTARTVSSRSYGESQQRLEKRTAGLASESPVMLQWEPSCQPGDSQWMRKPYPGSGLASYGSDGARPEQQSSSRHVQQHTSVAYGGHHSRLAQGQARDQYSASAANTLYQAYPPPLGPPPPSRLSHAAAGMKRELDQFLSNTVSSVIEPQKALPDPSEVRTREGYTLSEEQTYILEQVVDRKKSVFFTGSAGTGKSVLLRELIAQLRSKHVGTHSVAITAATGIAACNIGGTTVHSFSGIGLGKDSAEKLIERIKGSRFSLQKWKNTQVLIIDEISMLDGELFDKLEEIARTVRENPKPFGGIQLVVTGDFFQLPPVPDSYQTKPVRFAFEAQKWSAVFDHTIQLTQVFRQKDPLFAAMLNEMREGRLSPQSIQHFQMLNRPLPLGGGVQATELFPTRLEVDNANTRRMDELKGEITVYDAIDGGCLKDQGMRTKMLENFMAPKQLVLKLRAQVMLIKNVNSSLVNGSVGTVLTYVTESAFMKGCTYRRKEPPHETLMTPAFMAAYRNANNDGLGLRGWAADEPAPSKNRYEPEMPRLPTERFPVVRFVSPKGHITDLLCGWERWDVTAPPLGEVIVSRRQIPLILSWALSIHKAQGQTLERVRVDLGKVFERGQAYVALSRATSMAGLQVIGFDPAKVMAHERVKVFYKNLQRVNGKEVKAIEQVRREVKPEVNQGTKQEAREEVKRAMKHETKQETKQEVKATTIEDDDDDDDEVQEVDEHAWEALQPMGTKRQRL